MTNFACATARSSSSHDKTNNTKPPPDDKTVKEDTKVLHSDQENPEKTDHRVNDTSTSNRSNDSVHQCLSSSGTAAPSRHDDPRSGVDDDSAASEGPIPSDDPFSEDTGYVLDPNNDGDLEILKKRSIGVSNLTFDLDQLRSAQSPSLTLTPDVKSKHINISSPAILESPDDINTRDETDNKNTPSDVTKPNEAVEDTVEQESQRTKKQTKDDVETEEEIIERENQRMMRTPLRTEKPEVVRDWTLTTHPNGFHSQLTQRSTCPRAKNEEEDRSEKKKGPSNPIVLENCLAVNKPKKTRRSLALLTWAISERPRTSP